MAWGLRRGFCVSSWPINAILLKQIHEHGYSLFSNIPRAAQPGLLIRAGQLEGVAKGASLWVKGEQSLPSPGSGA